QRRFASNAAHQLRTPLAGLKTYAQLAEKETDLEKVKELVRTQVNGLDRMTRTVQQLLSLSKAEHAITRTATFKPVDLNIIVSDATTDIVPESIERQVELDFQAEESQALVEGDSISLRELTTNLLENAIRYNRPGGTVVINVTNRDTIDLII
ncbi:MAG TPA: histidine kinase dimerization/phospho-acceptor domain-containing protein, partial [Candidatus Melainabacteria bacterium]|nr:histidine kinase dimerization/phospho-acceptor domain-containing protein [Candidatus Melainabacteria bacterium]